MDSICRIMTAAVTLLIIGVLGGGALYGGPQPKASNAHSAMVKGKNPMIGMIFCNKMPTGELCPGGTTNTLRVSGEAATRWRADIHQYDKAMEAAQQRLLAEARRTLSAQQYSQVAQWFEKGLNPLMNQLLVEQGRMPK